MSSAGIEQRGGAGLLGGLSIRAGDMILGRYRVERVLGEGGMGTVVAAQLLETGERYAVKILSPKALVGHQAIERFMREARAVERLKGEHVAKVHEIGRIEGGSPCMVMDLLVGSDLQEVLQKRGYLALDQAVDYVLQACEGVAEAHALGIIHRDLKPANLFLTWQPSGVPCVKVLDFGIAKHVGPGAPEGAELTRTGMVFGSPAYMSPEQMKHTKNADARSDVWSMGVVLYQLVTGTLPFFSEAIFELAVKVAVDKPVPPGELCPGMPAALEDVILRCLEKNADRRHQTMRDLMAALSAVRVVAETSTLLLLPPTEPAPPVVDGGSGRAHPGEVSTAPADGVEAPQAPAESALKTLPILGPHAPGLAAPVATPASHAAESDAVTPRVGRVSSPGIGTTTGLGLADTEAEGSPGGVPVPAIGAIRYARAVDAAAEGTPPIPAQPIPTLLSPGAGPPPPDFELTPDTPTGRAPGDASRGRQYQETALLPGRPAPPPVEPSGIARSPVAGVTPAAPQVPPRESSAIGQSPLAGMAPPEPSRRLPSIWDTASPDEETHSEPPMPIRYVGVMPAAAGHGSQRSSSPGVADRPSGTHLPAAVQPVPRAVPERALVVIVLAGAVVAILLVLAIVFSTLRGGTPVPEESSTPVPVVPTGLPPPVMSGGPTDPTTAPPAPGTTSTESPAPSVGDSKSAVPTARPSPGAPKSSPAPGGPAVKSGFDACFSSADCRWGKKCVGGWCR